MQGSRVSVRGSGILAVASFAAIFSAAAVRADEALVAIGQLALRDHTVIIGSSGAGLRYTVRDRDGAILEWAVTLEELIARQPEIGRLVESAVARQSDAFPWAGTERQDRLDAPGRVE